MAQEPDGEFVKSLTTKEIKKLARPEFAANPDKFYPTKTLRSLGFSRHQCPKCQNNYWRRCDARTTCGDSQCEKKYTFIGKGTARSKDKKYTYGDAWNGFKKSLSSARVPCTPIDRYPVVARWRADVDFVAAGIFCFQPYCVTGELEPPANPLIQPQFCLRFNDLDNIGITGRHYSGFIMQGIQVFNSKDNYKFWADECIEFNYRWLTEELLIDPDEITFIEDVWAGGGNLGPSIEYFVGGLELGNMVFMQFKTFPDGSREPLQVQVIDVGIGLERVPWLVNGSGTSYMDVFANALDYLLPKIGLGIDTDIWDKYGPHSCLLNVDEVEDLDATWNWISDQIGMETEQVQAAIQPIKEVYQLLDHTRTVLMAVEDGSLPSNVGGASNVRNILRRVFALLHKNGWWEKLGMDGFLGIFDAHKKDLSQIYGAFKEYKSFRPIMELEYERWQSTDAVQQEKLKKLMKKKGGKLTVDDWIVCITSWGLPADTIARLTGTEIPGNLWYQIAENAERCVKAAPTVLYSTAHLKPTLSTYYANHLQYEFSGEILEVFPNVTDNHRPNIVVLDQSAFYPTSGGQEHDTGVLTINGTTHQVVDVMKVGPCVLHVIEPALTVQDSLDEFKGLEVTGKVDEERRNQLRNNHTATHIVYASSRKVLGPHVWQNGAKKTPKQAHLDITHFQALTHEQVMQIQMEANRVVQRCRTINKGFMPKDEAEKQYGFHLYQGGVVPGNELRVVNIMEEDTEACCGTHADNTAEVGTIKILKTSRISDGIVRLSFVAGERALECMNDEAEILHNLTNSWGISQSEISSTAERFFDGYKKLSSKTSKQDVKILELEMKVFLLQAEGDKTILYKSDMANPTLYISNMPQFAQGLKDGKKNIVFVGKTFLYGICGDASVFNKDAIQNVLNEMGAAADAKKPPTLMVKQQIALKGDKKLNIKPSKITDVVEFSCFTVPSTSGVVSAQLVEAFAKLGFVERD